MFDIINKPLGIVLEFIAGLTGGSFAAAVFIFTLLINVALIPLSIKSQKSSVQQTRIKPKLEALKKQYGDDKQAYNREMQKLYQEENVSMSGGCLPMILRLLLMISIYSLIMSPLTYMSGIEKTDKISSVSSTINTAMNNLKNENESKYDKLAADINWRSGGNNELAIVSIVKSDSAKAALKENLSSKQYKKIEENLEYIELKVEEANIDYTFISDKIDLTQTPEFSFDIFNKSQWIWLMPLMAFAAQMLSSVASLKSQKKINPDAPNMSFMMLTMPLISLFIGFSVPGGVAFYWACSSVVGGVIQLGVQNYYGPNKLLANERAKDIMKQYKFEETQLKKLSNVDVTDSNEDN